MITTAPGWQAWSVMANMPAMTQDFFPDITALPHILFQLAILNPGNFDGSWLNG